jgi:hypothetical protein
MKCSGRGCFLPREGGRLEDDADESNTPELAEASEAGKITMR